MRESGQFLMILLMLVGGSPGSTAGGIKTTTLAVLISCATAVFARKDSPEMFKRRIIPDIGRHSDRDPFHVYKPRYPVCHDAQYSGKPASYAVPV